MSDTPNQNTATRRDLKVIAEMVRPNTRVLDVGCGDGELLQILRVQRGVDARGIELSQSGVNACVARGLSVIQGDADTDLSDYPDDAFDFAILSQTIQATRNPREVLEQLLRIGRQVIVSLPNFAHWSNRLSLVFWGRMPVTKSLPDPWYATENIHLCTIKDFVALCHEVDARIVSAHTLSARGRSRDITSNLKAANFFGEKGVFLLARNSQDAH